ncbi:hypothetical protein GQ457_12G009560 [Hibiscus cannabinus]
MFLKISTIEVSLQLTVDARKNRLLHCSKPVKMIDDQDLGFFANFLGIFIFVLVIAYHFVMAEPKFERN